MRRILLTSVIVAATAPAAFAQSAAPMPPAEQDRVVMMSVEQVRALMLRPNRPSERSAGATSDQDRVVMMSLADVRRQMASAPGTTMVVVTPDVLDRLWSQRAN